MGKPYRKVQANEWFPVSPSNQKIACCTCGMVHEADFKLVGNALWMRLRENKRATAQTTERKALKSSLPRAKRGATESS